MADDEQNPWRDAAERGFEPAPQAYPEDADYEPQKRSRFGCLLWGCLITAIVLVLGMIAVGVGGYYLVKGQIEKYTDAEPMELPIVEAAPEEAKAIEQRIEAFGQRLREDADAPADPGGEVAGEADPAAEPSGEEDLAAADAEPAGEPLRLELTADDLNTLIASEPDLAGKVFVRIENGQISGDLSVPTDMLPIGGGRYFNASVALEASLENDQLVVRLVNADVKGQPLPQQFLDAVSGENLAKDMDFDAQTQAMFDRLESLRVEGDRVILVARPPQDRETAPAEAAEPAATVEEGF